MKLLPDDPIAPAPVSGSSQARGASADQVAAVASLRLDQLADGTEAIVLAIDPGASAADSVWPQQLQDLGFVPGERVAVMRRGWPGADPLVVRVGVSTYALRRAEAACIAVAAPPPAP